MGAFAAIRKLSRIDHTDLATRIESCFQRRGFDAPQRFSWPQFSLHVYPKKNDTVTSCVRADNGDFAFSTGTFIFRRQMGKLALLRLLDIFDPDCLPRRDMYGDFCVGIVRDNQLYLFTDDLAIYKVYYDSRHTVFSSSFLAVLESIPNTTINVQGVYEYTFRGATYGNDTVIQEIKTYTGSCAERRQINRAEGIRVLDDSDCPAAANVKAEDAHAECLHRLRSFFEVLAELFASNESIGLSGGYDSRLVLALLQEQGLTPDVYVYGNANSSDVKIAGQIARQQGFSIRHIDRAQLTRQSPDEVAAIVAQNFHAFDGYPDKGVFDNGSDLATRLERSREGKLQLNGGGGEIFRVFYPLGDVSLTPNQFVRRCYNDYYRNACTDVFSPRRYLRELARKIVGCIRGDDNSERVIFDRREIEEIYVNLRCRFWMGRNNSVNNTFGWSLTPFVDRNIVAAALAAPINEKRLGRFESRLISAINPSLAGCQSEYGHSFLENPTCRRRIADSLMFLRKTYIPVNTRVFRQFRQRDHLPYYLTDPYLSRVLDMAFPFMSRFFDVTKIGDATFFARVCTLEYLFEKYPPKEAL